MSGQRPVNTYETNINHVTDGRRKDHYVQIETSEPIVITQLTKSGKFEYLEEDNTPGHPRLVRFRIPFERVNWAGLAKRDSAGNLANLAKGRRAGGDVA